MDGKNNHISDSDSSVGLSLAEKYNWTKECSRIK